jgi:prepilin-type N-terminal cleavage/methylation domain-containing protein
MREEGGYSLVELIVVMAILGIVIGGLTTVFVQGSRGEVDMNRRFTAQQNARAALLQLRSDIHVGCNAAVTSTTLLIYKYKADGTCDTVASTVWCTGTSTNISSRLTLWEATAASCTSPPAGKVWADYIVSGSTLFTLNTPTGGSMQRMSVTVDLPVNANKAVTTGAVDRYELKDTIVLRNAPQA